jgi:hypothetical protein
MCLACSTGRFTRTEVNIEELKKAHELQQKIEINVSLLEKYREADTVIVRSGAESIANTIHLTTLYLTSDEVGDMIVSILERRIKKMREELRALGVDE